MREPCTARKEWWNVQADDGKMETAKTATPPVWLGKEPAERASASVSKVLASQGETSRSLLSKTGFEGRLLLFCCFLWFQDYLWKARRRRRVGECKQKRSVIGCSQVNVYFDCRLRSLCCLFAIQAAEKSVCFGTVDRQGKLVECVDTGLTEEPIAGCCE